jgi:hypothetical protein
MFATNFQTPRVGCLKSLPLLWALVQMAQYQ